MLTRPQPSLVLGIVPIGVALLTSNALAMAGLGLAPALKLRHHSVASTTAPETWGDAMLVPEQKEYRLLVPAIAVAQLEGLLLLRVEAICPPGAAIVGTMRPSTAGPRLLKLEMVLMLPAR